MVKMARKWAMPNHLTFKIFPINALLSRYVEQENPVVSIDPFANRKHGFAKTTNDLNPNTDTDYHMNALDFLQMYEDESVDFVLYDPPYSLRQMKEVYDGIGMALTQKDTQVFFKEIKEQIARITKPEGVVISFGWNSGGIGKTLGFKQEEILLVAHGGIHNDTIVTVERKMK